MVPPQGIEPRTDAYKAPVIPLNYRGKGAEAPCLLAVDAEAHRADVVLILAEAFGDQFTNILASGFIRVEVLGVETFVTEFDEIHFRFLHVVSFCPCVYYAGPQKFTEVSVRKEGRHSFPRWTGPWQAGPAPNQ